MTTLLPNAILSARPPIPSSPIMPPAPVRPVGGAGYAPPVTMRGGGAAKSTVLPSVVAASAESRRPVGRPDKAERAKEKRREASERIAAFAETKPSKRDVREFFATRIAELRED